MNTSLTSKSAEQKDKQEQSNGINFAFDELEYFVDEYYEMCEGTGNATLTYDNGIVVLTAVKFKTCDVVVYRLDESSHEYNRVSAVIEGILEEYNTENCEFKDAWETLLTALEDFKIVDEMLNP